MNKESGNDMEEKKVIRIGDEVEVTSIMGTSPNMWYLRSVFGKHGVVAEVEYPSENGNKYKTITQEGLDTVGFPRVGVRLTDHKDERMFPRGIWYIYPEDLTVTKAFEGPRYVCAPKVVDKNLAVYPQETLEAQRILRDYAGLGINMELAAEAALHVGEDGYGGFDTGEREIAIDYVSLKICGMRWPAYGDSDEYKSNFYKELHAKAAEFGVEVLA